MSLKKSYKKRLMNKMQNLERIKKAYINGAFDLDVYTSENCCYRKTINNLKEELEATDCVEELRFTPKRYSIKKRY